MKNSELRKNVLTWVEDKREDVTAEFEDEVYDNVFDDVRTTVEAWPDDDDESEIDEDTVKSELLDLLISELGDEVRQVLEG